MALGAKLKIPRNVSDSKLSQILRDIFLAFLALNMALEKMSTHLKAASLRTIEKVDTA